MGFVRLACLIHAANVRSEPGSNPSKRISIQRSAISVQPIQPRRELTADNKQRSKTATRTDRLPLIADRFSEFEVAFTARLKELAATMFPSLPARIVSAEKAKTQPRFGSVRQLVKEQTQELRKFHRSLSRAKD